MPAFEAIDAGKLCSRPFGQLVKPHLSRCDLRRFVAEVRDEQERDSQKGDHDADIGGDRQSLASAYNQPMRGGSHQFVTANEGSICASM